MSAPTYAASAVANSSGVVASLAVAKPASGSLLIATVHAEGGIALPCLFTPPAGWTTLDNQLTTLGVDAVIGCFWRRIGPGEPSSYSWALTNSQTANITIFLASIDGAGDPEAFAASVHNPGGSTGLIHTPDITGLGVDRLDVRFAISASTDSIATFPAGYTDTGETHNGVQANTGYADKAQAAGGSYGVHDFVGGSYVGSRAGYSVVLPPGGVARGQRMISYF